MITTVYQILQLVSDAGHTTLTVDDVAVDCDLRDRYGFGLKDQVVILTGDEARGYLAEQKRVA